VGEFIDTTIRALLGKAPYSKVERVDLTDVVRCNRCGCLIENDHELLDRHNVWHLMLRALAGDDMT